MQITIITAQDYFDWDEYVKRHNDSTPYHLSAYQQTLQQTYKLQTFGLMAKHNNKVIGVLPLAIFKDLKLEKSFCSLPYCDTASCLANDLQTADALISAARQLQQKLKISRWDYRDSASLETLKANNEQVSQALKVRMLLPLPENTEQLWQGLKAKLRNQIRKAEKNKLTIEVNSATAITDFYRVYCINMKVLGSPPHHIKWFQTINSCYQNNLDIVVIKIDQQAIAAGILLTSGPICVIPWASSLRTYNHLNANMLLYWQMLKLGVAKKCKHFDFGRCSYGENTYKFKKQWGSLPLTLHWQVYADNNIQVESATNSVSFQRKFAAKLWSILPLSLANFLGSKLRRYISL